MKPPRSLGSVLGMLVILSACVTSSPREASDRAPAPLGSFSLTGPTLGQQTLLPTRCSVGERQLNRIQQLGVSLELDCQLPSGDSIVGKAKDSGCR